MEPMRLTCIPGIPSVGRPGFVFGAPPRDIIENDRTRHNIKYSLALLDTRLGNIDGSLNSFTRNWQLVFICCWPRRSHSVYSYSWRHL